jgi:cytokinin dehydrogenase
VGGIGETSLRFGAIVDQVEKLEIVLMDGFLTTCSRNKNAELFESVLGGMGQFGAITSVTMKLMPSPTVVSSRDFEYPANTSYAEIMEDLELLTKTSAVMALGGHFIRKTGTDDFNYVAHVSLFDPSVPQELSLLKGAPTGPWRSANYFGYANRNSKGWDSAVASGTLEFPKPYVSFYLPWSTTESFVRELKSNPDWLLGAGRFYFAPLLTSNFGKSTFKLPGERLVSHLRLYKIVRNGAMGADHLKIINLNEKEILPAVFKAGGTVDFPFSPLLSKAQELQQLGSAEWKRLSVLNNKTDSDGLLNMNAGLFHD